jgi:hypothetical protein
VVEMAKKVQKAKMTKKQRMEKLNACCQLINELFEDADIKRPDIDNITIEGTFHIIDINVKGWKKSYAQNEVYVKEK